MKQALQPSSSATADLEQPAATLYIHIPFCASKCDYCSFNSYPAAGRNLASYMEALSLEAQNMAAHPWTGKHAFSSLYVGGGTPTIMDTDQLAGLIKKCLEMYPFVSAPEVTIEANPNTVERRQLEILKEAGVNRLSLGIQTFSEALLRNIGRSHSAAQAVAAFAAARTAGFENISIDLIYGLPGQNMEQWSKTIDQALALQPEHCAMYELMLEEGTALTAAVQQGRHAMPDEEVVLAMQEEAEKRFAGRGIQRYEISNYARPGYESRHNIHYWQNGSYIGLGAGAVSCLSGLRLNHIAGPERYVEMVKRHLPPYQQGEALGREAFFRETVIMGLRMVRGVSLPDMLNRFGIDLQRYYGQRFAQLQAEGLLVITDDCLRLTGRGLRLANQVLAELV